MGTISYFLNIFMLTFFPIGAGMLFIASLFLIAEHPQWAIYYEVMAVVLLSWSIRAEIKIEMREMHEDRASYLRLLRSSLEGDKDE